MVNLRPLTPHFYAKLYPQNGERIVTIDSVTSLHPMYYYVRRNVSLLTARPSYSRMLRS